MSKGYETLSSLRRKIDRLDRAIVRLLNQRARMCLEAASLKQADGLPVHDRSREREVLERVRRLNKGPLDDRKLLTLYRTIIRESRRLQAGGCS